ncbi:DUF6174 domain-containing protein [Streptomyces sp. NPDC040750]|uniref:DUF6174 domain-containing protein n=1 Tax=Streptomyces sp. NPDC040750 TaxID=3154491 RepID=UPI0033F84599
MTAGHYRTRTLSAAALAGALLWLATACDAEGSTSSGAAQGRHGARSQGSTRWREPDSYAYTLTSTTQVLAGTFRVEVRGGTATKVAGLDADSRRQVREGHVEVPTLGQLLAKLEHARGADAHTARAEYAADGHPTLIKLDWDGNTVDDEALYVISGYEER